MNDNDAAPQPHTNFAWCSRHWILIYCDTDQDKAVTQNELVNNLRFSIFVNMSYLICLAKDKATVYLSYNSHILIEIIVAHWEL